MPVNRRSFIASAAMASLPVILPLSNAFGRQEEKHPDAPAKPIVKLYGDGEMFGPQDYLAELQKYNTIKPIVKDQYGIGGEVEALEKKFAEITGKEKAIYMPSGTMANQLAIAVLSGENTKVFVQDTSHIYRDEADAAQSVFNKRLVPLAKNETFFTVDHLRDALGNLAREEVFVSGTGAVAIETPVRRADGKMVPIEELKKISAYCKNNNIKLHLDGARIYLASAWSGIPVKEYASLFDTVYISLYKYFGAAGGAVLCGDRAVIDKMVHLIKVHGGNMYGNWMNAAMALHRMEGFESRLKDAIIRANEIFAVLNKIPGVKVEELDGGTNIYNLHLPKGIDGKKLQDKLNKDYAIRMPRPDEKDISMISVNETLLYQPADYVIEAFRKSL